ncbi:aminotransferase class I/II-fold pyridoxal phosphate-dependent enzyme [uncultured Thermanaerothrix sp.]|uniref:aminotransferase class I/II-fold pyridoxal phosphate-dependent enzyme n=1 Tax=uncultured Thermanaerothrix sp. TaxID=1195149 RepID=UPI00262665E3|nr:aminotransferase class I/II-fold pyridoxal phosphate-dependent enzyme [uncultured Thermanaerothrix sp.]
MKLSPFKLERFFARYEFNVRYVLCASDCETFSVRDLLALEPEAEARLLDLRLGYTESSGAPSLRQAIARLYTTMDPDEILVHSGAEEAIFTFMVAVLRPGDHIIVHSPCYQSLAEVARGLGCQVSFWPANESQGWGLDPQDLRRLIRPYTRAVVINVPHNPTGYLMPREVFDEIHRLTQKHGLILFSDEVYRELEYDPAQRLPAACDVNPQAVSLGVMSKAYGLPGLRIGWVATHRQDLLQAMAVVKDYLTICNSAPAEVLAEVALKHREVLLERNRAILSQNLEYLSSFFQRYPERLSWVPPRAGSVAFPRLLEGDVEAFCEALVVKTGVLLAPGTLFDDMGNHFRLGLGRRNMPEALTLLEAFMEEWRTLPTL